LLVTLMSLRSTDAPRFPTIVSPRWVTWPTKPLKGGYSRVELEPSSHPVQHPTPPRAQIARRNPTRGAGGRRRRRRPGPGRGGAAAGPGLPQAARGLRGSAEARATSPRFAEAGRVRRSARDDARERGGAEVRLRPARSRLRGARRPRVGGVALVGGARPR